MRFVTGLAPPARAILGGGRAAWRARQRVAARRLEIGAGPGRQLGAELVLQHARADFLDLAFLDLAQLERAEGDADQPVDREPEMLEHGLDFAILALA